MHASLFKRWLGLFLLFFAIKAVAIPPEPLQNFFPVVILNKTTLDASRIFFVSHGRDPDNIPAFLVPNTTTGIASFVYPDVAGTIGSAGQSVTLSQLPQATDINMPGVEAYLIYLPVNSSSRGYLSIDFPVYLATKLNPALGVFGITDTSQTSIKDPSYFTLYQDFEYTFNQGIVDSSTVLFLNPSWVDYFCLPMQVRLFSYPTNQEITNETVPGGTMTGQTRDSIISTTNMQLSMGQVFPDSWGNLNVPFYTNPYSDSTPASSLRILAAKNSIGLSNGPQFAGAMVPETFFPSDYPTNTTNGPQSMTSYYEAVYNFYTSESLFVKIFPANLPEAVYQINSTGDAMNFEIQFVGISGGGPSPITLKLKDLPMEAFLSGSAPQWPFMPPGTDAAYLNELSKLISALFTVGQFPLTQFTSSMMTPFVNNNTDTNSYRLFTYFMNPNMSFQGGPWYNLYDVILHQLFINMGQVPNNPTLGQGFGYDFDDLLNMPGEIIGISFQDQFANPPMTGSAIQPYVVMSLESLSGTQVPNLRTESYQFDVVIGPGGNGVDVTFSHFNGTSTIMTPASATSDTDLGTVVVDATHPFEVTFAFNSINYVFQINLLHQNVYPQNVNDPYTAIHQQFQESVNFTVVGGTQTNPKLRLAFDSSPPAWPG